MSTTAGAPLVDDGAEAALAASADRDDKGDNDEKLFKDAKAAQETYKSYAPSQKGRSSARKEAARTLLLLFRQRPDRASDLIVGHLQEDLVPATKHKPQPASDQRRRLPTTPPDSAYGSRESSGRGTGRDVATQQGATLATDSTEHDPALVQLEREQEKGCSPSSAREVW